MEEIVLNPRFAKDFSSLFDTLEKMVKHSEEFFPLHGETFEGFIERRKRLDPTSERYIVDAYDLMKEVIQFTEVISLDYQSRCLDLLYLVDPDFEKKLTPEDQKLVVEVEKLIDRRRGEKKTEN